MYYVISIYQPTEFQSYLTQQKSTPVIFDWLTESNTAFVCF